MNKYVISSDTTCDLPEDYCRENRIEIHSLFYRFSDGEVYGGDNQLEPSVFYNRMRNSEMPTTMATNPEDSKDKFLKYIEEGYDIIHIAFSSALSSAYQNACIAAAEIAETNPDAKITVIDSLSASMGEGLLVYKAIEHMKSGHSYEETVNYVESIKLNISHQFTVDDLYNLHRGGRISKATAVIGTLINIKPLLHVDNEGRLVAVGKVRGRKKSLASLVDNMAATIGNHNNDTIMISHGDCLEDAEYTASLVREKIPVKNIIINNVCPTIGAHSGPGTIALFFEADIR